MENICHSGSDRFRKAPVAYLAAVPFSRGKRTAKPNKQKGCRQEHAEGTFTAGHGGNTEDVRMSYYLLESVRNIPDAGEQTVYGILVELGESGVTGAVEDISSKREVVVALLNKLADCTVSPRHVADVVADSIGVA